MKGKAMEFSNITIIRIDENGNLAIEADSVRVSGVVTVSAPTSIEASKCLAPPKPSGR